MKFQYILFVISLLFAVSFQRRVNWNKLKPMDHNNAPKSKNVPIEMLIPRVETRIVGGSVAEPKMFPYQAALSIVTPDGTFFCGGSLISPTTILTAAHCVKGGTKVNVLLGSNSLEKETPGEVELESKSFMAHPDYDSNTIKNDIGLVILPEEVKLSDQISLINLPSRSDQDGNLKGKPAVVSGFGKTSDFATTVSPVLRFAEVRITSVRGCTIAYNDFPKTAICVSGRNARGSCSGDSGGPLTVKGTEGGRKQVGIVSFGSSLGCQKMFPTGYTDVWQFLDFIKSNSDTKIRD